LKDDNPGCLGFVLKMFGVLPKNINKEGLIKLPYALRDDFLSDSEFSFYKVLEQVLDNKAVIFPKVSLNDIFFVTERDKSKNSTYFNKISRKHVDFLICLPRNLKPICGIELDDLSHNRTDRKERDILVNNIFKSAGLELIRFQNKKSYSLDEVEKILLPILNAPDKNDSNMINNEISEMKVNNEDAPLCPKCGTPMVLRQAKKGENKGNKFYGCSNFPKCKEIVEVN